MSEPNYCLKPPIYKNHKLFNYIDLGSVHNILTYTAVGSAKYSQQIAKLIACDNHLRKYYVTIMNK